MNPSYMYGEGESNFVRNYIFSPIFQSTKGRYFINFCSWNKVPEPKSPDDAIPVIGTPVLQDKDENGTKLVTTK